MERIQIFALFLIGPMCQKDSCALYAKHQYIIHVYVVHMYKSECLLVVFLRNDINGILIYTVDLVDNAGSLKISPA